MRSIRYCGQHLLREGEGWLSEETLDDPVRDSSKRRVWVVDPLDGTREFVAGIPEFCVSVAMVEEGSRSPAAFLTRRPNEMILGSLDTGVKLNGKPAAAKPEEPRLNGALVLASRSEVKRGEWKPFESTGFKIQNMGSVAYKLGRVAAGLADVTFTLVPKNEWDVAAGAALVVSGGGFVSTLENGPLICNNRNTLLTGLIASGPNLRAELLAMLEGHMQPAGSGGKAKG